MREKGDGKRGTAHFTHSRCLFSQTLSVLRGKDASRFTNFAHLRFPPFSVPLVALAEFYIVNCIIKIVNANIHIDNIITKSIISIISTISIVSISR